MSNADIFTPNGKINAFFLPPGGGAVTPSLSEVLTAGNSTGGTLIESSTGQMNLNILKVVEIDALDPLVEPAIGIRADVTFPDEATINFEGDGNLVAQGALTISKAVGQPLKFENVDNAPSAIPNVLAYDDTTGEVYYQPAGTSGTSVNSVSNSDGSVTVSPTTGNVVVSLPATGTAGTYAYPASLTTDAKGRVTSVTAGALPNIATVLTTGPDAGDADGNDLTNVGNLTLDSLGAAATSISLTATIVGDDTNDIQNIRVVSAQEVHIINTDVGPDATINLVSDKLVLTTDILNLALTKELEINGAAGTTGQYLKSQGTNLPPVWATIPAPSADTLSAVLAAGNSAGIYDINMNQQDITNVSNISNSLTNFTLGTANNIVVQTDGNTKFNGEINMDSNTINNVLFINSKVSEPITLEAGDNVILQPYTGKDVYINSNLVFGLGGDATISVTSGTLIVDADISLNGTVNVNNAPITDVAYLNFHQANTGLVPNGGDLAINSNTSISTNFPGALGAPTTTVFEPTVTTFNTATDFTTTIKLGGLTGPKGYVLSSDGNNAVPLWVPQIGASGVGGRYNLLANTAGIPANAVGLAWDSLSGLLI